MTTPRVTAPVEPEYTATDYLRLIAEGWEVIESTGSQMTIQNPEDGGPQELVIDVDLLSAAPAPEGGAVDPLAGWTPHDGVWGEPPALAPETLVHVLRRNGNVAGPYRAGRIEWHHQNADSDPLFYRPAAAPAEAGEIGAEYDAAAHCVTLAECPPGLFLFNGALGFKSQYGAMEPLGSNPTRNEWKVGSRADAYCADSGEYFWGGTWNHDDRAKLLVYPIDADVVAMVASHGPSALRAQPPAREDAQPVAKPAPFNPGGIGHAMYQAFNVYLADYVLSTDGADYEPTPFERDLIEDFFAGLMAEEAFFGPVRALYDTHPAPDAVRVAVEALERIATVDMGGGFLGAQACRQVATKALSDMKANQKGGA